VHRDVTDISLNQKTDMLSMKFRRILMSIGRCYKDVKKQEYKSSSSAHLSLWAAGISCSHLLQVSSFVNSLAKAKYALNLSFSTSSL
jgi:hypothetical protein